MEGATPGPGRGSGAKVKRPGLRVPQGLSWGAQRGLGDTGLGPRSRVHLGPAGQPGAPVLRRVRIRRAETAHRGSHRRLAGRSGSQDSISETGTPRPEGSQAGAWLSSSGRVEPVPSGRGVAWRARRVRPGSGQQRTVRKPRGPGSGRVPSLGDAGFPPVPGAAGAPARGRALHPRPTLPEGGPRDCSDRSAPHEALFPPPSHVRRVASPRKGKKSGVNR